MGFREPEFRSGIAAIAAILIVIYAAHAHAQSGKADYRHYCASCHGLNGKGRGTWNGPRFLI